MSAQMVYIMAFAMVNIGRHGSEACLKETSWVLLI